MSWPDAIYCVISPVNRSLKRSLFLLQNCLKICWFSCNCTRAHHMCSECNCARSCENKERDTDQTEAGLSSSALLILDANTGSANRPRRKCNLSIQSSTGTGLSLSIMPSGAYPVGDNALLAEHWVVNHWSGGHSCTFSDQFPHQTPGSVVAAQSLVFLTSVIRGKFWKSSQGLTKWFS